MAALTDAKDTLRSTNCEACAENRAAELKKESTTAKQPTERQLDELKELRDEFVRLNSEFSVCKHVTEGLLEDMRKLTASAEKAKDELSKELEDSKQATKHHLEELKELKASAERDKDELRKELQESKQTTKRHLEELEELRALSRKEHSEHKENTDPSEEPLFKKLRGFFGSTKSRKKKKRKKYLPDETTTHHLEEGLNGVKREPSNRPVICRQPSVEAENSGIFPHLEDRRSSLDRNSGKVSLQRKTSFDRYSEEVSLQRSFESRSRLMYRRGSGASLAYGRTFSDERQDLDDAIFFSSGRSRVRRVSSINSLPLFSIPLSSPDSQQSQIDVDEQPKSQKQKEGARVEFKFKVQGTNRLIYQWYKDGVELPGQHNASLILECIELRDFGRYTCRVSYQDDYGETVISSPAVLDVIPQCLNGTRPKLLQEVDLNTRDEIGSLLENKRYGLGGWRQVAAKYGMQDNKIAALDNSREPGKDVLEFLMGSKPELTVYSFCKVLKENKIKRFDIAKLLEDHLLTRCVIWFPRE